MIIVLGCISTILLWFLIRIWGRKEKFKTEVFLLLNDIKADNALTDKTVTQIEKIRKRISFNEI